MAFVHSFHTLLSTLFVSFTFFHFWSFVLLLFWSFSPDFIRFPSFSSDRVCSLFFSVTGSGVIAYSRYRPYTSRWLCHVRTKEWKKSPASNLSKMTQYSCRQLKKIQVDLSSQHHFFCRNKSLNGRFRRHWRFHRLNMRFPLSFDRLELPTSSKRRYSSIVIQLIRERSSSQVVAPVKYHENNVFVVLVLSVLEKNGAKKLEQYLISTENPLELTKIINFSEIMTYTPALTHSNQRTHYL